MNALPAEPRNEAVARHFPVKRETIPDDDREALARAHFDDWRRIHPGTLTWATYGESHKQRFYDLADVAIGAGFRRQGPITDAAQVLRDAADELEAPNPANRFRWAAPARAWLRHRAAAEAARSAP